MNFWYHGVSGDPPELMYRSDLEANPFPPGTNFFKIPIKTAHGVFNTPLNDILNVLANVQITNVVVEWYEESVTLL